MGTEIRRLSGQLHLLHDKFEFEGVFFLDLINMFPILSLAQLQDQLAATANKEFDPLGPLPHGWGKYQ